MVTYIISTTLLSASRAMYAGSTTGILAIAGSSTSARALSTTSRCLIASEPTVPLNDLILSGGGTIPVSERTKAISKERKRTATHSLHVKSSRNNIILTYTDDSKGGKVFRTITGGIDKDFKKAHRSSYEAAHQAALKVFKAIEEHGKSTIRVAFNGIFGQGREAVAAALAGPEGIRIRPRVVKVEDRTPIKIGGTRAKKPRRL